MTHILSFDTETKGFNWFAGQTAFLGQIADEHEEWAYDLADDGAKQEFTDRLWEADVLVAHNAKFDVHQVRETLGVDLLTYKPGQELHCTDLMSRVFWPEGSYGEHGGFKLSSLTKVYLDSDALAYEEAVHDAARQIGYTKLKDQPGMYYDVYRAYPDVMLEYAKRDVRFTWDLFQLLRAEYDKAPEGQQFIYDLERKVLPILIDAEHVGVELDEEAVKHLHVEYKRRERDQHAALIGAGLPKEALGGEGSQEALEEFLLKQGVPLYKRTDNGKLSTAKGALEEFETTHPFVADFLAYRTTEKFLNTYIEPMLDVQTIHTSFQPIGTWTGRMACRRPNLQNIPVRGGTEVRNVFVAREGYKLACADYDNIEVRILAYYLGAEGQPYRDLINDGLDPHAWMASVLYGGAMDDYVKGTDKAHLRAQAKNKATFPIIYGAGGMKLCILNGLETGPPLKEGDWEVRNGIRPVGHPSYAQGKALARKVKGAIPGYMSLTRRVKAKVEAHGYVTTLMGRKQALIRDKSYVGLNALIQGSAADVMKEGLVLAANPLYAMGGRVLLVVHDEIVAEVPEDCAEAGLAELQRSLEAAAPEGFDPPLLTSGVICDTYGEAK